MSDGGDGHPLAGRIDALRREAGRLASRASEESRRRSPDPARVAALSDQARAAEATARALETASPSNARRALAERSQARASAHVDQWRRPSIDGDAGPKGPGRGEIEAASVSVMTYSDREKAFVPTVNRVVRRVPCRVLQLLPADEQATAERFQVLMEGVGALRCADPSSPPSDGRISDGGAAVRWDNDRLRADAVRAIGYGMALRPRGAAAHADRGRRPITDLAVVELIVLRGMSVRDVLARHQWSRRPEHRKAVREALSAALRRIMQVVG